MTYEQSRTLLVAVVGHTNTGKTSLLRTLLHDVGFGQISSRPATTRDVRAATISSQGKPLLTLFDTPGLEDGVGLYAWLEANRTSGKHHDGPERIQTLLDHPIAQSDYEQESKVLKQLLVSDAAFFVIDARDPVLPKFMDELAILQMCGKPIVPVLNHTAAEGHQAQVWTEKLARIGLHHWVAFDTVSPQEGGETQVYEQLVAVLPAARKAIKTLIAERTMEQAQRRAAAIRWLGELITDVSACQFVVQHRTDDATDAATFELQRKVVAHEQSCLRHILQIYGFRPDDARLSGLSVTSGTWQEDLFDPDTLRDFGVKAGKGIAAGGAAGASIDVMTGGFSLGAGTLIGAAAGGIWQSWQKFGQPLQYKLQGYTPLRVDDGVIEVLAKRQLALIYALQRRGHAALEPISHAELRDHFPMEAFVKLRKKARQHPQWSALPGSEFRDSPLRQQAIDAFGKAVLDSMQTG
ncbi:GTPase/DUF3482 domain-containing protein [Aliidiomarina sanyensis]|nr:GTPase/DUF3482 domain-containing protein [Aliidiomarina sanyensis]